jgi:hypothetical protein
LYQSLHREIEEHQGLVDDRGEALKALQGDSEKLTFMLYSRLAGESE